MVRKASYIEPSIFKRERLKAFFTTKHVGTDPSVIARHVNFPVERIYFPIQRHTSRVQILRKNDPLKTADAIVTREKNILLGVKVADCVPVLLYDRSSDACGAVHAGWRGTADNILTRTIELMCSRHYSKPEDLLISIGPSIRWCCYAVGQEVLQAVTQATGPGEYSIRRYDHLCLDLPTANRVQAMRTGVPGSNIWMSNECTYCYHERFFSYRFSKRVFGNQGGFIGLSTAIYR